jgi:orotidine-5'-phosphate decarboxylase
LRSLTFRCCCSAKPGSSANFRSSSSATSESCWSLRDAYGGGILVVVPGIRGESSAKDDQKRTVNVEQAFANGADYIVVGREIRDAADPRATALEIQKQIAASFAQP